jgi:hypothetical protein
LNCSINNYISNSIHFQIHSIMSNKASDSLHRLIKSMSKPEKRYFKVFSSRHVIGDQNNYQILFDAIDKLGEYDESKLMKKFANEAFINRFSIAKSRLYNSILKSLDAFHSNSSVEAQLKRTLHCAEILYNKSLYGQSLKLLKSAKKSAQKHEKITTLIEINKWEKRIIEKDNYQDSGEKEIQDILDHDKILLTHVAEYNRLWNIKSKIFQNLYVKGKARSTFEKDKFSDILKKSMPEDRESLITENRYLFNHIYSAYHYGIGDYEDSYPFLVDNVKLIEDNTQVFAEEPNVYISVLTNAIYLASKLGKQSDTEKFLAKLKAPPKGLALKENEDIDLRYFILSKSTELTIALQTGDYDGGIDLIPEIEEGLLKYDAKISSVRRAFFYFNIAILFFRKGHFNESLKWMNQLLNNVNIDHTQDIHCMAQLLNLVIHLELGNRSLLPYTLRSTQRYLETRSKVYEFETIFLDFINELLKKRQNLKPEELYAGLAKELQPLTSDPFEKHVFDFFDFVEWAEEKSLGKAEVAS